MFSSHWSSRLRRCLVVGGGGSSFYGTTIVEVVFKPNCLSSNAIGGRNTYHIHYPRHFCSSSHVHPAGEVE